MVLFDLGWEGHPGRPNVSLLCACPPVTLRGWASTSRVTMLAHRRIPHLAPADREDWGVW